MRRHGKFLVVELEASTRQRSRSSRCLIHLGMTGQILVCPPMRPSRRIRTYFWPRRRSRIALCGHSALRENANPGRGARGPLSENLASIRSKRRRKNSSRLFAPVRTNQGSAARPDVLRGMGNIYTDESLLRARIHPMRIAANLKEAELRRLYRAMRMCLNEAIRLRGSSVSDYVDSEGRAGSFSCAIAFISARERSAFAAAPIQRAIVAAGAAISALTASPRRALAAVPAPHQPLSAR